VRGAVNKTVPTAIESFVDRHENRGHIRGPLWRLLLRVRVGKRCRYRSSIERAQTCGAGAKVKLEEIETQTDANGLDGAFQTAKKKHVNAIMTTTARPFFTLRKEIVELANKHKLPTIYYQKEFVDDGGLMSYAADYADLRRSAAERSRDATLQLSPLGNGCGGSLLMEI